MYIYLVLFEEFRFLMYWLINDLCIFGDNFLFKIFFVIWRESFVMLFFIEFSVELCFIVILVWVLFFRWVVFFWVFFKIFWWFNFLFFFVFLMILVVLEWEVNNCCLCFCFIFVELMWDCFVEFKLLVILFLCFFKILLIGF